MQNLKTFLFQNINTKQTVVKNVFWLFTSETSSRLLKMGLVIYAARILGAGGWGTFSYAISISSLLMIFSDIGISDLVMRELTQKKDGYRTFISTSLALRMIILVVSTILVIIFSKFISHIPEANTLFPIIALILFFDSMRELGLSINRASEKMERDMTVKTTTNGLIFLLGIVLLIVRPEPMSMAIAYLIGSTVGFFIIAFILRKEIREFIVKIDTSLFRTILSMTWPFALITFIAILLGNIDIYMLGMWGGAQEVGLYSSMQRIQSFIIIIPTTIAVAVFPLLSRLANTDTISFRNVLERGLSFILMIGLPVALCGALVAPEVVTLVFGSGYIEAVPILRIFMITLLFSFPLVLLSNAIVSHNKQKGLTPAYLAGIVGNILLNLFLIPHFGAIGAATATCFSTAIITLIIWSQLKKINNFKTISHLTRSVGATTCAVITVILMQHFKIHILITIGIVSAFYASLLWIFKEPMIGEISTIFSRR